MATARNVPRLLLAASVLGLVCVLASGSSPRADVRAEPDGRAERLLPTNRPTVEAAFPRESYSPGNLARLVFWTRGSQVSLQVFRAGTEDTPVRPQDAMLGTAVTSTRRLGAVEPGRAIRIRIGEWPSGLYFAKLVARGGKVGYAPFVLRPRALGENHVAVVLSTMTWQAYNFHDDDGNGTLDTWYAGQKHARLGRPYENVPEVADLHRPRRRLSGGRRPRRFFDDRTPARRRLRPDRLSGSPRVRDPARVRRRDRLSEPRRQPHVPFRQ